LVHSFSNYLVHKCGNGQVNGEVDKITPPSGCIESTVLFLVLYVFLVGAG